MKLSLICALAENGAIGLRGGLLYRLPADLKHFKQLTVGHTVLMGRKTFESLPKGALPDRRNLVVSRQPGYAAPGIEVFASIEEALAACAADEVVFAMGGESVYAAALPLAADLYLTHIHATPAEADTFFPACDLAQWKLLESERHEADERNAQPFTFAHYRRSR